MVKENCEVYNQRSPSKKLKHMSGPTLAVYSVRLLHAVTCPFSKYFQCCTFLPKCSSILPFFNIYCPFSEKLHPCPYSLDGIGPACTDLNLSPITALLLTKRI